MKKMKENDTYYYKVIDIRKESDDVSTIFLDCSDFDILDYKSGQYITVYFPESGTKEGKAYSISSAPSERIFTITVRAVGEFSNKITSLKKGDLLLASKPYGYFYTETEDTPIILIAGGIGITPLRSIVFDNFKKNREIVLLYSAKNFNDIVFKNQFDELANKNQNFKVKYFLTSEKSDLSCIVNARIQSKDIFDCLKNSTESEFFVCGSISFTRDIWKVIKDLGISDNNIYTEAFF